MVKGRQEGANVQVEVGFAVRENIIYRTAEMRCSAGAGEFIVLLSVF